MTRGDHGDGSFDQVADLRKERDELRAERDLLAHRLEERRRVDSLRRALRDGQTVEDATQRGLSLAAALLGDAPSLFFFEDVVRGGFSCRGASGIPEGRYEHLFVERSAAVHALAERPVIAHSRATPIAGFSTLEELCAERTMLVTGVREGDELVGLLVAQCSGDEAAAHLTDAADEIGVQLAVTSRLQSRVEETARYAEQETMLATLISGIEQRDQEIQGELFQARRVQQLMVTLPVVSGAKVYAMYEPMSLIGGDVYAVTEDDDRIRLFVADALGHGVRAALTTMILKSAYDSLKHLADPVGVLRGLNDSIAAYNSSDLLFTGACVDVDRKTGAVVLASAGHPAACLVRGGEIVLLEGVGPPLGYRPGGDFTTATSSLGPGDGVYLVTDGISEAHVGGRFFGEEQLYDVIRRAHVAGEDVGRQVREVLLDFVGSHGRSDDASLVGIRLE